MVENIELQGRPKGPVRTQQIERRREVVMDNLLVTELIPLAIHVVLSEVSPLVLVRTPLAIHVVL